MKRLVLAFIFTAIFALAALADIPRPTTPKPSATPKAGKSIDTSLSIELVHDATEARLVIPRGQIKQLRAQLDEIDGGEDNTAAVAAAGFTGTRTIVSGMLITFAFVFGGVWLARSGRMSHRAGRIAGAGAFLFIGGALASVVFANVGPPAESRSITGKLFGPAVHSYKRAWGKIKLEASDSARNVELIVPDPQETATPGDEE
jgi:hypothetical protein